jgi:SAM-dependent methyltransferase
MSNRDDTVIAGFGDEWTRFDQSAVEDEELNELFEAYFRNFPWQLLPRGAEGFDLGCGSGRWARRVAERVGTLHCVDPSPAALAVARRNLLPLANCVLHQAAVDELPLASGSMDFGYSLGVLHHVPDTLAGLRACVQRLKPGAPFLLYLYYAFDNRAPWFRAVWRASDALRRIISRLPIPARYAASQVLAAAAYWPLARGAKLAEGLGVRDVDALPLSYYRNRSLYTMRTDALDRFGTRLEQRFTRREMQTMMEEAGLERISFNDSPPYWVALGFRRRGVAH